MFRLLVFLVYCSMAWSAFSPEYQEAITLFKGHQFDELNILIQQHPKVVHEAVHDRHFSLIQYIAREIPGNWRTTKVNSETPLQLAERKWRATKIVFALEEAEKGRSAVHSPVAEKEKKE